jgi:hypothetical protein
MNKNALVSSTISLPKNHHLRTEKILRGMRVFIWGWGDACGQVLKKASRHLSKKESTSPTSICF